jgi:hypothetical protein
VHIDWNVAAAFAAPVITLFVGIWVNRRFGDSAKLISYYGHVATFRYTPPGGKMVLINTHAVVIRNAGRKAATNVRLSHYSLPDFNVSPPVQHYTQRLSNGGSDIVIPTLVPGELVTVSYLYFPPLTANQINAGIKCDQGFAQEIPVMLQRRWPTWWYVLTLSLFIVGFVAVLYILYDVVLRTIL